MSKIKLINTDIKIRPSSVDNFVSCPQQWARVYLGGERSIPSCRASIGTAIHKAAEVLWTDSILTRKKDANYTKLSNAAVDEYTKIDLEDDLNYDSGEDYNTAVTEVAQGVDAFINDIVPYVDIPEAVEIFVSKPISDNPIITSIGGTIDYLGGGILDDVKTSKRKPIPQSHVVQQTIYKILAEANGHIVNHNRIQGIVLKKSCEGHILELEPNVPQAKLLVNTLLDTVKLAAEDKIDLDILFRGNPKHFFCSFKYCAFYKDCKFVKGE